MKVLNCYGITKKENGVDNVRNSKVSQEEDKLIQQKLQEAFGYTDEQLAAQLDQAAAEYAAHPELNLTPPKGEFEKILAMAAQDETQDKKEDGHKVIRLKKVMKPMILVATVGAILLGTGMMASGRRYYRFWERDAGNGQIIFNNVDAISEADSLEKAYEEIEKQHYEFYIQQIDWIISDFYENQLYRFDIKDNDHYINLHDGDKIIFNVLNNKEKVSIKFGIINRNFCADKIVVFTQKEFKEILERLKKIDVSKKYDTTYSFIDSSLEFNFWNEQKMQFLDIIFEYNNNSTNKYMISLDSRDTKKLYKLISKQVNKKI